MKTWHHVLLWGLVFYLVGVFFPQPGQWVRGKVGI